MGNVMIGVKMEHPKISDEDLEQIEHLIAMELWYATRILPYRIKTMLRRCDIEIDVNIRPVLGPKEIPVNVWIDDFGGENGTITSG